MCRRSRLKPSAICHVQADVTINEKATLHLANGTVADTYDGPYRMTYQLERGGDGCWRIVAGHVRFGSY